MYTLSSSRERETNSINNLNNIKLADIHWCRVCIYAELFLAVLRNGFTIQDKFLWAPLLCFLIHFLHSFPSSSSSFLKNFKKGKIIIQINKKGFLCVAYIVVVIFSVASSAWLNDFFPFLYLAALISSLYALLLFRQATLPEIFPFSFPCLGASHGDEKFVESKPPTSSVAYFCSMGYALCWLICLPTVPFAPCQASIPSSPPRHVLDTVS